MRRHMRYPLVQRGLLYPLVPAVVAHLAGLPTRQDRGRGHNKGGMAIYLGRCRATVPRTTGCHRSEEATRPIVVATRLMAGRVHQELAFHPRFAQKMTSPSVGRVASEALAPLEQVVSVTAGPAPPVGVVAPARLASTFRRWSAHQTWAAVAPTNPGPLW